VKELAYLNKYLWKYKLRLFLGVFFVSFSNVFSVVPAQVVRHAFDLISENIDTYNFVSGMKLQEIVYEKFYAAVLFYGLLIIAMAFLRGFFTFMMRQVLIVMSRKIEYDLKSDLYHHIQSLPLAFYKRNNTGDLMARISEDVSHVRMYLGPAIMYSIGMVSTFVVVISYMLTVSPVLTFYSVLPLPFLSLSIYYVNQLINQRSAALQKSLSEITTFVQETFAGIRVVKSFAQEARLKESFFGAANIYRNQSLSLTKVNALFFPLILGIIGMSTVITVYVGGLEVARGAISPGVIAEFVMYVGLLTWPVTSLGWVTSIAQRAAASQKRINEIFAEKNDIQSAKGEKSEIAGNIQFEKVRFVYPDSGITALNEVSFDIKEGQTLGIIGAVGSGKSSIANLICRMYDASGGTIRIDGKLISDFDTAFLRSQIGYVQQDVVLFSDSIRNNIAFGFNDYSASEEAVIQAAKDADLLENIKSFPKGFDTEIGERGISLSGGQKQRVSIARALIRNPKILILDDCLSAVDTKTESVILENLKRIMQNRTSVIISHRISSVKLADKIIVLEDGKIKEEGTHEELLEKNGLYRELYEKQLQAETQES
jgi:ATP-binding cassette subfamily B protein